MAREDGVAGERAVTMPLYGTPEPLVSWMLCVQVRTYGGWDVATDGCRSQSSPISLSEEGWVHQAYLVKEGRKGWLEGERQERVASVGSTKLSCLVEVACASY